MNGPSVVAFKPGSPKTKVGWSMWVLGQPDWQREFHVNQGYTMLATNTLYAPSYTDICVPLYMCASHDPKLISKKMTVLTFQSRLVWSHGYLCVMSRFWEAGSLVLTALSTGVASISTEWRGFPIICPSSRSLYHWQLVGHFGFLPRRLNQDQTHHITSSCLKKQGNPSWKYRDSAWAGGRQFVDFLPIPADSK